MVLRGVRRTLPSYVVDDALSRKSTLVSSLRVSYLQILSAMKELILELETEASEALIDSFVVRPLLLEVSRNFRALMKSWYKKCRRYK